MQQDVLILGITGSLGQAVARAMAARGWQIRALHRDPETAGKRLQGLGPIAWLRGDAMNGDEVAAAARGARIIVHAVNPPGYRNWRGLAIPMLANTIAAARSSGARILFPGNVYNYGPDAFGAVTELSPRNPRTRKGRIRVEMETMLADGAGQGARAIILRAGDFFGANGASSWFENALVK
ncbi:MAG TPA: NAD-dependent epimerase/dehydratase family protein, partial [Arenicellales bacterium]|nr:NAD-dependent epimerase/dehydratase family protein [Arenicellales bacterium]